MHGLRRYGSTLRSTAEITSQKGQGRWPDAISTALGKNEPPEGLDFWQESVVGAMMLIANATGLELVTRNRKEEKGDDYVNVQILQRPG